METADDNESEEPGDGDILTVADSVSPDGRRMLYKLRVKGASNYIEYRGVMKNEEDRRRKKEANGTNGGYKALCEGHSLRDKREQPDVDLCGLVHAPAPAPAPGPAPTPVPAPGRGRARAPARPTLIPARFLDSVFGPNLDFGKDSGRSKLLAKVADAMISHDVGTMHSDGDGLFEKILEP
ncbi:hypothetical protein M885DRAFT_624593 [Pelagophyceae sp. CCMP2097]|nr:hypothetical protein M885DRAFT_624593 [Pelagophyceae sp. CCMP2097]